MNRIEIGDTLNFSSLFKRNNFKLIEKVLFNIAYKIICLKLRFYIAVQIIVECK